MLTAEKRREVLAEALPILTKIESYLNEKTDGCGFEIDMTMEPYLVRDLIEKTYRAAGFSVQLGLRLYLEWKRPGSSETTLVKSAGERYLQTKAGLSKELDRLDQEIEAAILRGKSSIINTASLDAQKVLRSQGYTVEGEISW